MTWMVLGSNRGKGRIFFFSEPTQPPIQRVPASFPGNKAGGACS